MVAHLEECTPCPAAGPPSLIAGRLPPTLAQGISVGTAHMRWCNRIVLVGREASSWRGAVIRLRARGRIESKSKILYKRSKKREGMCNWTRRRDH